MPYCRSCGLSMSETATVCPTCGKGIADGGSLPTGGADAPTLIATFGVTTAWVGKTITYADGRFNLEGHGAITARDVLSYDQKGHLVWPHAGMREWVEQLEAAPTPGALAGAAAIIATPAALSAGASSSPTLGGSRVSGLRIAIGVAAAVVLIIIFAAVTSGGHSSTGGTVLNPLSAGDTYTLQMYNQIQTGMTLQQIQGIAGSSGTQDSHVAMSGITDDTYSWANPDGTSMNVSLQNGAVVAKGQFGLK